MKTRQTLAWAGIVKLFLASIGIGVAFASQAGAAQSGGGGGFVGGGGGSGGLRGPATTSSGRQNRSWGGKSSVLNLLANPEVQRELELSAEQRVEVERHVQSVKGMSQRENDATSAATGERIHRYRKMDEQIAAMRVDSEGFDQRIRRVLNPSQLRTLNAACERDRKGMEARPTSGSSGSATRSSGSGHVADFGISVSAGPGAMIVRSNAVMRSDGSTGGGGYSSGGFPGSAVRAIRDPELVRSLGLDEGQASALARIREEFEAREARLRAEFQALRPGLPSASARFAAVRQTADVANEASARIEALLTPAQRARMEQISIQADGTAALLRPSVVDALKLTATQQAKLAALARATRQQVDDIMMPGGSGIDPRTGELRPPVPRSAPPDFEGAERAGQQGALRMMAVLNPTQRQAFERLKGRPYPGLNRLEGWGGGGGMEFMEERGATR